MYRYTPKKEIARRLDREHWRSRYDYARKLLKPVTTDFLVICEFIQHYPEVDFWSKKMRNFIPVRGFLLPVKKLFNEERYA